MQSVTLRSALVCDDEGMYREVKLVALTTRFSSLDDERGKAIITLPNETQVVLVFVYDDLYDADLADLRSQARACAKQLVDYVCDITPDGLLMLHGIYQPASIAQLVPYADEWERLVPPKKSVEMNLADISWRDRLLGGLLHVSFSIDEDSAIY